MSNVALCSPAGSFNELCSPHSLEEGASVSQHELANASRQDVCSDAESIASCAVSHVEDASVHSVEAAFLEQAELHLRRACTEKLLATWHKETRLRWTGTYLKLHTDRTVQVSLSANTCSSQQLTNCLACTQSWLQKKESTFSLSSRTSCP